MADVIDLGGTRVSRGRLMEEIRDSMALCGVPWHRVHMETTWHFQWCGITARGTRRDGATVIRRFLVES